MTLDDLDGAVERVIDPQLVDDLQWRIQGRRVHGKLVDQPIAQMRDVAAAAPIHQHVVLVAREPSVEPLDQPVERRARDQFAILRAENSDRRLGAPDDVENFVAEQRLEHAVAEAEHHQIVFVARLMERAKI